MLVQGRYERGREMLGRKILSTNLDDARRGRTGCGQDRAETEIVREHDVAMLVRPLEDDGIGCSTITDVRPMNGGEAASLENGDPPW